jgi:hypothetical protein
MSVQLNRNSRLRYATLVLIQAAVAKDIAEHVNEPLKSQILTSSNRTISYIADDYCGTGSSSKTPPKPVPGPNAFGVQLAVSLATFANVAVRATGLRSELMRIAGIMTQKAYEQ